MSKITEALQKAAKEREERLRQQQEDKVPPPSKEVPSQSINKKGPPRALPTVPLSPPSITGLDPHLVTYFEPHSPASEQYRLIRTNIQSLNAKNSPHTLVISSSTYGEGKTITAINLAIIMAQDINKPILLIDGDIWKPQVYQYLNLTPKAGLADFLTDNISLESILLPTKINNLTVLPGSKAVSNPSSLLESAKMKHLLTEIKSRFEYIIIDTAPVLAVTDAGIIARETDGVLLVIKANATKREVIQRAQSVLAETKAEILGYVLTHVEHPIPDFIYRHL
ncbi:MAG: CpsD/CapB family tyrosine-protein kinase [Nitrospirae bacterium]|nr:CpsD/CapB family tyrosine-protein kinase [Nitrospirota bacterium]